MKFKTPVALFIYKRRYTTFKVFEQISKVKPEKLFIIGDGPKNVNEQDTIYSIRDDLEKSVTWDCNLQLVYSDKNMGLANRVTSGLDEVFKKVDKLIILEDDTLPDNSFFYFCQELLEKYKDDDRVGHISGCNHHEYNDTSSYNFCSVANIWGWATWKRAWLHFDLKMPTWREKNKKVFMKYWIKERFHRNGMIKMFDLHCINNDPWAWSYQWLYALYSNNLYSVVPKQNLVSNIGIGPSATNTISDKTLEEYPPIKSYMKFPLNHPTLRRNIEFEKYYYNKSKPSLTRRTKNALKSLFQ